MINIHEVATGFGVTVEVEILDYCYPFSTVRLTYNEGKGVKVHFAKVGYIEGRLAVKTKNPISNSVQAYMRKNLLSANFITRWDETLTHL